jgi:hypothetical protein
LFLPDGVGNPQQQLPLGTESRSIDIQQIRFNVVHVVAHACFPYHRGLAANFVTIWFVVSAVSP